MLSQSKYYILNETLVDPDVALKHREILSENVVNVGGRQLLTITFKQVLQDFARNWNGRIYRAQNIMNAITRNPLIQHDLKMNTWSGEYGHPLITKNDKKGIDLTRQFTIFPPNACWTIANPRIEGDYLVGECTTLAGGYGDMVRDRVLTNFPAQASSRAIGGVDRNGEVTPDYTLITYDCVIRPSHKTAYMDTNTVKFNQFQIPTGQSMTECVAPYDFTNDPSFSNFLLSESSSKEQIEMLCETFHLDVDSMVVGKKNVSFRSVNENGVQTIIIPLNRLVNVEYYNLF